MATELEAKIVLSARDQTRGVFAAMRRHLQGLRRDMGGVTGASAGMNRGLLLTRGRMEQVRAAGMRMRGMMVGLAGALGFAGLTRSITGAAAGLDDLSKASRRIDLPLDKLRAFAEMAEQAGTSQEQAVEGLKQAARTYAEIRAGVFRGAKRLDALSPGIANEIKQAQSAAAAIDRMFDAIRAAPDQASKLALAERMFGPAAEGFVELVEKGPQAFDAEMERIGKLIGDIGDEGGRKVEDMNDRWFDVVATMRGFREQMAVELSDDLTASFKAISAFFSDAANRKAVIGEIKGFLAELRATVQNTDWAGIAATIKALSAWLPGKKAGSVIDLTVPGLGGIKIDRESVIGKTLGALGIGQGPKDVAGTVEHNTVETGRNTQAVKSLTEHLAALRSWFPAFGGGGGLRGFSGGPGGPWRRGGGGGDSFSLPPSPLSNFDPETGLPRRGAFGGPAATTHPDVTHGLRRASGLGIPAASRPLLEGIASVEAGRHGYNAINYVGARSAGNRFESFRQHPFAGQKGYTAAGRYQMLASNFSRLSKRLGLKDFGPESQDKAAWQLAKDDYQRRTGRDLEADMGDRSRWPDILRTLGPTWHGLRDNPMKAMRAMNREAAQRVEIGSGEIAVRISTDGNARVSGARVRQPGGNLRARLGVDHTGRLWPASNGLLGHI